MKKDKNKNKDNRDINRNNLKYMREIYGATQEEVADLLGVSRVSISNWENGTGGKISRVNLEKLANLYGLGIEYFYDRDIDSSAKDTITEQKSHVVAQSSEEKQDFVLKKDDQFQSLFKKYSFQDAVENYMYSMRLIIALADNCSLEELELTSKINEQMSKRLNATLENRRIAIKEGDEVQSLLDQLSVTTETQLF